MCSVHIGRYFYCLKCSGKCMFCLVLSGLDMCITYILIWYIHIYVLYEIAPSNALLQRRHITTHLSASLLYLFLFLGFLMFDAFLVYPLLPLIIIFQSILPKRSDWNTNCLHIFLFQTTLYPQYRQYIYIVNILDRWE